MRRKIQLGEQTQRRNREHDQEEARLCVNGPAWETHQSKDDHRDQRKRQSRTYVKFPKSERFLK